MRLFVGLDVSLEKTAITGGYFPAASRVVDTTAAGDSFNGAFLAALLMGRDEATAMDWGHRTAGAVIGQPGAIVPETPDLGGTAASAPA